MMETETKTILDNTKLLGITICYMIISMLIFYLIRAINGEELSISDFENFIRKSFPYILLPFFIILIIWINAVTSDYNIRKGMIVVASIELCFIGLVALLSMIIPIAFSKTITTIIGALINTLFFVLFISITKRYK